MDFFEICQNVPEDVLRQILGYDGRIRYHDGTYVGRIHPHEARCEMLRNLVLPEHHSDSVTITLNNRFFISNHFHENTIQHSLVDVKRGTIDYKQRK
jgi:hypothetical protein